MNKLVIENRIKEMTTNPEKLQELRAMRKEAGRRIDPETAEVTFYYCQTLDPYGDFSDLPDELHQIGGEYFARSPNDGIWIWFGDLPETTREALRKRLASGSLDAGFDAIDALVLGIEG